MIEKKLTEQGEDAEILAALLHYLRQDTTDSSAAMYLFGLVEAGRLTSEAASALYRKAITLLYFSDGRT